MKTGMLFMITAGSMLLGLLPFNKLQAQKNVIRSTWAANPKIADGKTADWQLPFKNQDDNTRLQYSFANDTANLYICIIADEGFAQNKISMSGLNIWLDATGKKQQQSGIGFPVAEARKGPPPGAPGNESSPEKWQQQIVGSFKTIRLQGLNNIPAGSVPLQNQYGITASLKWDSLNMVIEYKIPLNAFSRPADTSKPFLLCIELPGMNFKGGPPDGMPPMGMEGGGPEGMEGGMGDMPPPPGDFNEMAKADIVWLKIKLANAPF